MISFDAIGALDDIFAAPHGEVEPAVVGQAGIFTITDTGIDQIEDLLAGSFLATIGKLSLVKTEPTAVQCVPTCAWPALEPFIELLADEGRARSSQSNVLLLYEGRPGRHPCRGQRCRRTHGRAGRLGQ